MLSILYLIALPFLTSFLCLFPLRFANYACVTGSAIFVVLLAYVLNYGSICGFSYNFIFDIPIALDADFLGAVFAMMVGILSLIAICYTVSYLKISNESHQNRFMFFYTLSVSFAIGMAFSVNLITMFIFYELLTMSTYPLIVHSGSDEAKASGRIYLMNLLGSSLLFLLPAICIVYVLSGKVSFESLHALDLTVKFPLFILFTYGVAKAALFPMHSWLPRAMVAPAPVSALLHSVAVVKGGIFMLIKIYFYMFRPSDMHGLNLVVTYIAAFAIIFVSVLALSEKTIKGRLAYSTIAQLSYMVMSASLLTVAGIRGAFLHMITHSFAKISLFFIAGIIYTQKGIKFVEQMRGLAGSMPVTMVMFSIACLAIIGMPLTSMFWSKFAIFTALGESNSTILIVLMIVGTVLNVGYFLPMIYSAFTECDYSSNTYSCCNTRMLFLLPAIATVLITVVLFAVPIVVPNVVYVFLDKINF